MSEVPANSFVFAALPRTMPAGLGAAPIFAHETGSLRVCVAVRQAPKAGDGPFVLLRETLDARVYLGCLADADGRVQRWLEVWVQDISGLAHAMSSYREAISNKLLDERWKARCERLDDEAMGQGAGAGGGIIRTGFESKHPAPVLIDIKRLQPVPARDRQNATWALCTDEAFLAKKQAPAYAATLGRHLYQPELGPDSPLLPVDLADAAALGQGPDVAALNPGAGLMMVTRLFPLGYEQVIDAITGVEGETGPGDALLGQAAAEARRGAAGLSPALGWLMLPGTRVTSRLVEALHLKLSLLAQAVAAVRASVADSQSPLLNVTARSFRVRLGDDGSVLPLWWTARAGLVEPGEGVELDIPGTEAKYFVAGRGGGVSIYSPAGVAQAGSGRGWLRLRNVVASDAGGVILEGTLTTQDRVIPGKNDLVWLRFALGAARMDLYAIVDHKGSMVPGEVRLRTIPHKMSDETQARVKQALGVPIPEVSFEIVPLLSSPCDLYALGVLAVRTLLTGKGVPLPVALDELLSLAGAVGKEASSGETLVARVGRAFTAERRWAESLGPQLLVADASAAEAQAAIPPALWHGVVAATIRCFSGLGPDSRCKDFGDAPLGGLHKVFDGLADDLYALLVGCRTLIVSDYTLNAEVRGVVQACLQANR